MTKLRCLSIILLASFTILMVSCTKEGPEGPMGAVGPQGIPGNGGATGGVGTTGAQGPPGTANVIYSSWIPAPAGFYANTFNNADWKDTTIPTIGLVERANVAASSLTQAILDRGVTMVYHTFAAPPASPIGGANAQPLPYSLTVNLPPLQYLNINYRPAVGRIVVFVANLTSTTQFGVTGGHFFRYIIVPGTIAGGRMANGPASGYTLEELQALTYDEILRRFDIPRDGSNQ